MNYQTSSRHWPNLNEKNILEKISSDLATLRRMQIQALIESELRISGHNQKSEDFENIQENQTTYNISTECFKAVVAGLWPAWLFSVAPGQK